MANDPPLTPYLTCRDAAAAIEFYRAAFVADEEMRLADPQGRIAHAQLRIHGALLMLAEEFPGFGQSPAALGGTAVTLHLYVADADAVVARAVAAGATVERAVQDQFYGDRSGTIVDPFGHRWMISMRVEAVSTEEMRRRYAELLKQGGSD